MIKKGPDVIDKVLAACYEHNKNALFTMSLMHQYEERGWLTRKQLEGLHNKASKISDINPGLLATLQATINKMPVRDKTPITETKKEDNLILEFDNQINEILEKYPQHKAILNFKLKRDSKIELNSNEKTELNKLYRLLIKKPA